MIQYYLAPTIRQRFFDANGVPLSGGLLYTYEAGTTTPQATYTDSTGDTPNANPIVLDPDGYCDVWLPSGTWKFVLEDSNNNMLWTKDNIQSLVTALSEAVNIAGALDIINNLSDVASASASLVNLGISPWSYPNRYTVTENQSATALANETFDALANSSLVYEYEVQQAIAGYMFSVTSANATSGATYTNNGNTYTVSDTIAAGTRLFCSQASAPQTSGTLTKASGTGDATITFSAALPLYSVFGNGMFRLQFINGVWTIISRTQYDNGTPIGVTWSVSQSGSIGTLQAAETGVGNGTIKTKRHLFFT